MSGFQLGKIELNHLSRFFQWNLYSIPNKMPLARSLQRNRFRNVNTRVDAAVDQVNLSYAKENPIAGYISRSSD